MAGRVALHRADDRRPRGVDARPRQALHEADQPGRDPRAEHRGGHGGAAHRGHRQRGEDRRTGREIAREPEPDDGHGEERQDAEDAIHEDRCDGVRHAHPEAREAHGAHGVAADAGGEEGTHEGADEEDVQDGAETDPGLAGVAGCRRERHQQPQPPYGHQRAVHDDEQHGGDQRPRPRVGRVLEHQRRLALPEDERGETERDDQPQQGAG